MFRLLKAYRAGDATGLISKRRSNRRKPEALRKQCWHSLRSTPFVSQEVLPGPEEQTDDQMIEEIRVRGVSTCIRSAPAGWVARSTRLSIPTCASMVSSGCVSPTPRKFPEQYQRALDHDRREMRRHGP
jgi:hypothetical protein